jgi:predicted transcriptional regulator
MTAKEIAKATGSSVQATTQSLKKLHKSRFIQKKVRNMQVGKRASKMKVSRYRIK